MGQSTTTQRRRRQSSTTQLKRRENPPKGGKGRQHHWKEEEKRNSTQRRRPSSTAQHKTRVKAAPPRTPPERRASKAAPLCWNVDLTQTLKSMWRYSHTCSLKFWNCAKEKVSSLQTSTDVRLLDETRRRAICRAAQQSVFSMNQRTTVICTTTCGSGNGAFDCCRQLREIFRNCKETQQISKKIKFRIPKLFFFSKNQFFELSREVLLPLVFFFIFPFFKKSLSVFLVFLFFESVKLGTEEEG